MGGLRSLRRKIAKNQIDGKRRRARKALQTLGLAMPQQNEGGTRPRDTYKRVMAYLRQLNAAQTRLARKVPQ